MKIPRQLAFITEPYTYVVMDLEYFARGVARLDSFTYGFYSFDSLLALTGLKHWMTEYFNLVGNPYAPFGWKDYTAFWIFYRDFGPAGIMVIPLLLGSGISVAYYSMRRNPSLKKVVMYSIMVYVMVISFFYFSVSFLWFFYYAVVFYLVLKIATSRVPAKSAMSI
jgi:hypothetical protein